MVRVDVFIPQPGGLCALLALAAATAATVDDVKKACERVQPMPRGRLHLELQLSDDSWMHADKSFFLGDCLVVAGRIDGRLAMRLLPS